MSHPVQPEPDFARPPETAAASSLGPPSTLAVTAAATDAQDRLRLLARISELQYLAARQMDAPVVGSRGQHMTLAAAQERAELLASDIDVAEMRGCLRHRRVDRRARLTVLVTVGVVDLPIMLWLVSSVLNVDWSAPFGISLAIAIVVAVLGTCGAASALHHLGRDLRAEKDDCGRLSRAGLSAGSIAALTAAALLTILIAVVMFVRVYSEGRLSGVEELAVLLALLVSVVMLVSAGLVFWTAFRDGSPERDDLAHYSEIVGHHLTIERRYEDEAVELMHRYELLRLRTQRDRCGLGADDD